MKSFAIIILVLAVVILLAGGIFLGFGYFSLKADLSKTQADLKSMQIKYNVIFFNKLFIEKVLLAQSSVSYQDRLALEKAVQETQDKDIQDQWAKFLSSTTEVQAQQTTMQLLKTLAEKLAS